MKQLFDKNGTQVNLLERGDIVIKQYSFLSAGNSKIEEIGKLSEIGLNYSKIIVAPFVSRYNSIPSSSVFLNNLVIEYESRLLFLTDTPQKYQMVIQWVEWK